jgi:hypothetical protein
MNSHRLAGVFLSLCPYIKDPITAPPQWPLPIHYKTQMTTGSATVYALHKQRRKIHFFNNLYPHISKKPNTSLKHNPKLAYQMKDLCRAFAKACHTTLTKCTSGNMYPQP